MSLFGWIVFGILILLVLAFVFRMQARALMSIGSSVAFVLLALLTLSSIFWPELYDRAAEALLEGAGVLDRIQDADDAFVLNQVADTSRNILDDIRDFLELDEGEEPAEIELLDDSDEPGVFERLIYPAVVTTTGLVLRGSSLVLGLAGMIAVLALSYASSSLGRMAALQEELEELRERVARMEGGEAEAA